MRSIKPFAVVFMVTIGCTGAIGDGSGPGGEETEVPGAGGSAGGEFGGGSTGLPLDPKIAAEMVGQRVFRRLALHQYLRVVKDLLGVAPAPSGVEEVVTDQLNDAEYTTLAAARKGFGSTDVLGLNQLAHTTAHTAMLTDAQKMTLVGCRPTGADTCARTFVQNFGRRAFRRPLEQAEADQYLAIVGKAVSLGTDVWTGVEYAVAAMLQSPNVLYIAETGEPDPDRAGWRRYTSYEMATRLSFAVTDSTPDVALLDAAGRGDLVTSAGVRAQTQRLLGTAAGKTGVINSFFGEFFALDDVSEISKALPKNTPTIGQSMRREIEQLMTDVVFTKNQPFAQLFTRRDTFLNKDLSALYGSPALANNATMTPVTFADNSERVGILGTGAFLALHAGPTFTSPPSRALAISSRFLCVGIAQPPDNADEIAATFKFPAVHTKRQEAEARAQVGQCAGCHAYLDPLGLPLERFDALGSYRTSDRGLALDTTGQIVDGATTMRFDGLTGMADALGKHSRVAPCLARQFYRFASGRREGSTEEEALDQIGHATKGQVIALVTELVASSGFRRFVP